MLNQVSFLGGLSDEQRSTIYEYFEMCHAEAGDWIEQRGKPATRIHIIQRGRVELLIHKDGQTTYKRDFNEGDSFGEAAMLSLVNNNASFRAAEPCELLLISNRNLLKLHHKEPKIFSIVILNIARDLARKLQYTDEMLPVSPDGAEG